MLVNHSCKPKKCRCRRHGPNARFVQRVINNKSRILRLPRKTRQRSLKTQISVHTGKLQTILARKKHFVNQKVCRCWRRMPGLFKEEKIVTGGSELQEPSHRVKVDLEEKKPKNGEFMRENLLLALLLLPKPQWNLSLF